MLAIISAPTAQTVTLLADLNEGSEGSYEFTHDDVILEFDGKLYFAARSSEYGNEIFVYDGNDLQLLKDINPNGSADCQNLFQLNDNQIIFTADDGTHGRELWVSDGTESGTQMVIDLRTGSADGLSACCGEFLSRNFAVFNDELYFNGNVENNGVRLFKTDGTADGTLELATLNHPQRRAGSYLEFNGELFFSVGFEGFWKTDGTPDGTVLLQEFEIDDDPSSGDFEPFYIIDMGDYMLMANGYDWDVWRSDGTVSGTYMVKKMVRPEAQNSQGAYFFRYGNIALFSGSDAPVNTELWRTDGTESGTYMVKDIETDPGFIPIYPKMKTFFKGKVFYVGGKNELGHQIYFTDGTESGTDLLVNLQAQGNGQVYFQSDIKSSDTHIFFVAGAAFNRQLWATDGTADGTFEIPISNVESTPERMHIYGDELFFWATGDGIGKEPHIVDISNLPTSTHEIEGLSLSIYPNPVSSIIYIDYAATSDWHVKLYDSGGALVLSKTNTNAIDVKNLTTGLYWIEIFDTASGQSVQDKIVIQQR